jgi:hypothetical protein
MLFDGKQKRDQNSQEGQQEEQSQEQGQQEQGQSEAYYSEVNKPTEAGQTGTDESDMDEDLVGDMAGSPTDEAGE